MKCRHCGHEIAKVMVPQGFFWIHEKDVDGWMDPNKCENGRHAAPEDETKRREAC